MNRSFRRSMPQTINKPGENGNYYYNSNKTIIGENTGKTLNGKTDDYLKLIADSLPLIAWIADMNGNPEYFNHYWFEYTGHTVEDSLENNLLINLIHPDDRDRVRKKWEKSIKTGNNLKVEYRLKNKSGNYKWFLRRVNAVRDSNNNIIKWIGASTDIDEQKKLEKQLIRSREQLEIKVKERTRDLQKSNENLEQFAFVASHDLKVPLRTIAAYSNLIISKSKDQDSELVEFLGYIHDGVKQMTLLINDLLDFSRVGRFDTEYSSIDLNDLVQSVLESLSYLIKETGAEIHVDPLPSILASPTQIRQLFQNLIENAIKFRKKDEKPVIHISVHKKNSKWLFAVKDNGIGIDPRFADVIFDVFHRLHGHENYSGTGIGLSVCKKVVEFYKGKIWVDSKPGEGATFYFTLPGKTSKQNSKKPA